MMIDRDGWQRFAYWATLLSGLALVVFSMFAKSPAFAALGVLILLSMVFGNPLFQLADRWTGLVAQVWTEIVKTFVTGLSDKLSGKVSPELNAAVKALNAAHDNDKALDSRIQALESGMNAVKLSLNVGRREVVSAIVGGDE